MRGRLRLVPRLVAPRPPEAPEQVAGPLPGAVLSPAVVLPQAGVPLQVVLPQAGVRPLQARRVALWESRQVPRSTWPRRAARQPPQPRRT